MGWEGRAGLSGRLGRAQGCSCGSVGALTPRTLGSVTANASWSAPVVWSGWCRTALTAHENDSPAGPCAVNAPATMPSYQTSASTVPISESDTTRPVGLVRASK